MNRIVIHSRVGADGVLQLTVPVGEADADREVEVTIEPAKAKQPSSGVDGDWHRFVRETAGAWQGDLVREPQGEFEEREELP